jgi:DNA primase
VSEVRTARLPSPGHLLVVPAYERGAGVTPRQSLWPPAPESDFVSGLIESWPTYRPAMSDHLRLKIAGAVHRGRPLDPGAPVPGCPCEGCTGLPANHPARVPAWRRLDPAGAAESDEARRLLWEGRVDLARSLPLIEVTARLGCGEPVRRSNEVLVRCPLHDDERPSMRLDPGQGLWYCDPCGEGGDGIKLWMRARRLSFVDAVRELGS